VVAKDKVLWKTKIKKFYVLKENKNYISVRFVVFIIEKNNGQKNAKNGVKNTKVAI